MDPGEIPAIERLRVSSKRPINANHRNAYEQNTGRASEGLRFPKDASESHCLIIGVSPQRNLETTRALEGLHVPTELFSLSFLLFVPRSLLIFVVDDSRRQESVRFEKLISLLRLTRCSFFMTIFMRHRYIILK